VTQPSEPGLFVVALRRLTRLPVPNAPEALDAPGASALALRASVRHDPGVGLLVGGWGALVLWAAAHLWPGTVAVGLAMVATVWLTGALGERGLAATCDALGGSAGRAQALAILGEGRLGGFGAVGLLAVLGLKAAALFGLATRDVDTALLALPLAHALSRVVSALLGRWLPAADAPAAARTDTTTLSVAALWCLGAGSALVALGLGAGATLLAAVAVLAVAALMARWLALRLGGFTGATLGAVQQGAELTVYLLLLAAQTQG